MSFVTNSMRFPTVHKIWKSVNIWHSHREFKGGNFFDTQCSTECCSSCWVTNIAITQKRVVIITVNIELTRAVVICGVKQVVGCTNVTLASAVCVARHAVSSTRWYTQNTAIPQKLQ